MKTRMQQHKAPRRPNGKADRERRIATGESVRAPKIAARTLGMNAAIQAIAIDAYNAGWVYADELVVSPEQVARWRETRAIYDPAALSWTPKTLIGIAVRVVEGAHFELRRLVSVEARLDTTDWRTF